MLPKTFHPLINRWFCETYGKPTSVQAEAWPLIERGESVLALAPTGSGKTLTAFLSAISRFCTEDSALNYNAEKLSVLYVSPLKALNEDIKRNLLEPLAAIKLLFQNEGREFPSVRVETRSGDTPQSHRRRFYIRPPSILALTPESLAIILLNPKGRQVLSNVKYLIIDEIHALLGNKRGAFLSCQIDRLALIAGDFQRISLSATISNPQTAAEFTGSTLKKGRQVHIVSPLAEKKIDFIVEYPDLETVFMPGNTKEPALPGDYTSRYTPLINYVLNRIWEGMQNEKRATILVFTDSRRRAERLCYFLNQTAARTFPNKSGAENLVVSVVAYPHHGSLSKEIRRSVEKKLAAGTLACVVATASLELGIDIGHIEEVVLAGSTTSVSQALQRIGRSGHGIAQVSKGRLFAFHGKDLLLAAALKAAVDERDVEEIYPVENPQDILAQIILALCSESSRKIDELYELINKFYIFRNLNYDSFSRVVYMLAGITWHDKKTRLKDVKPRIWVDNTEGTIGVLDGTTTLLYTSGGVIANLGYYSLRLPDGTKIGELDEEFVWERRIGDHFDFGGRGWRITNISTESVDVTPLDNISDSMPFWKGAVLFRSVKLTKRLLDILDNYNNIASSKSKDIKTNLSVETNNSLKNFLDSQYNAQNNILLSCSKNIAVEIITGTELNRDFCTVVFHSFRGGQVNYPLSLALSAEMEEILNLRVESFAGDDCILFLLPRLGIDDASLEPEEIVRRALAALDAPDGSITRGERLFRNRLESSALFGAFFREAAERSLLLPKAPYGRRTPLWIMRQRSKRLFDAVADEDGFPVTAEAWRSCLSDTFDMEGFRNLVLSIKDGSISLSFFRTGLPSPFSRDIVRYETNAFMYEYDERKDLAGKMHKASLSDKIIEEAIGNAELRPVLKSNIVNEFTSKLRREIPGWAPDDDLSLNEWVKERIAIPIDEWNRLLEIMPEAVVNNINRDKIKTVRRNNEGILSVVHFEWEEDWIKEPLKLLGWWLRYQGPVLIDRIRNVFAVTAAEAEDAINALAEVDEVVTDIKIESTSSLQSSSYICDRENMEMLLRITRKKNRPVIKERAASVLAPFLALCQGLIGEKAHGTFCKNLYGRTAASKLWETEIFCARNNNYDPETLNREIREGRLLWYGKGSREKISFCRPEDFDLVCDTKKEIESSKLKSLFLSSFFNRSRDFWEIKNELSANGCALDIRACAQALWNEVWKGSLTADSFDPVRRGIENGFIPKETEPVQVSNSFGRHNRIPSALRNRWRSGAPVHGNWFSLLMEGEVNDPMEEDALNRDRVRLLLDRWGVLCRPLLEHEEAEFSWSKLLPAMRRMELAGELVTGRFFSGINSLQFASVSIAALLEKAESCNELYWMNAADPASIAGLEISGLEYKLTARNSSNRFYYRGESLIAISCKSGKEMQIFIDVDDPDINQLIGLFKIPRTRKVMPENKVLIQKINGIKAAESDYAEYFKSQGFLSDMGRLIFW